MSNQSWPLPPNSTPADLYTLLGKIDGKMDVMTASATRIETKVDGLDHRVTVVENRVTAIETDRAAHLPSFHDSIGRIGACEDAVIEIRTTGRLAKLAAIGFWSVAGTGILALVGWLIHHVVA